MTSFQARLVLKGLRNHAMQLISRRVAQFLASIHQIVGSLQRFVVCHHVVALASGYLVLDEHRRLLPDRIARLEVFDTIDEQLTIHVCFSLPIVDMWAFLGDTKHDHKQAIRQEATISELR